ncbi:MAG: aminomethyl-transferring glycine dehydrogenase subunit GcvPB [Nitrososphaerota archaeon]|nr:aminomethyl-transferring glycine dehydrogenase subunit GcvPB [Nitrososphaerales archaeon]MDW8045159.1 aminomethyl-transferring glycine dehydrogenase subunit GcvPB [Nitrososphaerota archaeon]
MGFKQATWDEPLLIELGKEGRCGYSLPKVDGDLESVVKLIPERLLRKDIPLPSLSEPQVVRHFVRLSQMNYCVDLGMYPLGSCTMKYNPKIAERIASDPHLTRLHPYQPVETVQGILEIMYNLSKMLAEITGTAKVTLAPAAGAHGEFVGCLIIRAYIKDKGELKVRNEMLIPESAHGTNPASAVMAGFKVVKIPTDEEGLVDIEALKAAISQRTAGMMLTVPNTLGLFERRVEEISKIIHEAGGLMYYDGANMNALLGRVRPGDMGFDIVHMNLHKTFATPHGGGGPGSGPLGVSKELVDFLPVPLVDYDGEKYFLNYNIPKTIGRIKGFYGNISVLIKAYTYILMVGSDKLKEISNQSVLASNYLLSNLNSSMYLLPYSKGIPRKHEFVVSAKPIQMKSGVRAMDIAKSLLDLSLHAPTIYFPLIVDEALMIEPTETEPMENLDEYAKALNTIAHQAEEDPQRIIDAPINTSIKRLDEVKASHPLTMKLNWRGLK